MACRVNDFLRQAQYSERADGAVPPAQHSEDVKMVTHLLLLLLIVVILGVKVKITIAR